MYKNLLLLILMISLAHVVSAQSLDQQADSLMQLIENETIDTIKARHYVTLGALYVYSNPKKALGLIRESLAFSEKIGFDETIGLSYLYLFNVNDVLGSHVDTLKKYVQLLEQVANKTNDPSLKLKTYWSYAFYHGNFEEYDKSLEYFLKALELVRKHNLSKRQEAQLLGNIGGALNRNGDQASALKYYKQSLAIDDPENYFSIGVTNYNIANIYNETFNDVDSALIFLDKAMLALEKSSYYRVLVAVLIEQGKCYDKKSQFERAYQLYNDAYQMIQDRNLGENQALILGALAQHYLDRKAYQSAIEYSDKAIDLSEERQDYKYIKRLYRIKEKACVEAGEFEMAYEIKSKMMARADSVMNTDLKSKVKQLQTEYEVEQKDLENNLLKAETEANRKTIQSRNATAIALFLVLLLLSSWAVLVWRSNRQKQKYNEELEATVAARTKALQIANKSLEQANYELKTFNYIASHDIKEPIRNIGNYAGLIFRKIPKELQANLKQYFDTIKKNSQQLYTLIEDFAKYSQMSKDDEIEMQPVDLNVMIDSLEMSLSAEVQEKNGLIINNGLPEINTSTSILYTILKSLIDNGLKFNESAVPTVEVSHQMKENTHEIYVRDNGIGIAPEYHDKVFDLFKRLHHREKYQGSGIGLAIVKLLVEKIDGDIHLQSVEHQGSTFIIRLPKRD